ncbi:MAG: TonB-dependent receptor plug domain-containing protein [Gemmatimonadetes bacterium]|nr:TonB-dependent receptor plug domain-containing protein [Gemmatimonadota bacterium]MXX70857.1 TonB-dependent receptor plug domain-containing protein [Gemmatimonadota bacterium]MYC92015.1 TonB-dependent receptor plug domain-containing protein [Gemmatimonadota bacterium]MYG36101.1 TonB-dependent receptor plug domain-containing protein [Gemmatimonadota bacterium]
MHAHKSSPIAVLGAAAVLAGFCPWAPPDLAAQRADSVTITGHIQDVDTESDLEGAVLELSGLVHRYVTGADGRVTFAAPIGNYTLTIRRSGYVTLQGGFRVLRPGSFNLMMRKGESGNPLATSARLLVRVVDSDSGAPVEGAMVAVLDGRRAFTNAGGRVEFADLESDLTRLTVERIGYATREEPIALHPDRTTVVEVAMTVEAVALRPLTVEVRSSFLEARGYYRRLDDGIVMRLLTRRTIEEQGSPRISDAFARLPGLRINRPTTDRAFLQVRDCELAIFVDGVEWNVDMEGTVNIDHIPPEWVEVAEVYWGARTPPEFRGRYNGGCGSALIWTRQAVRGN